MFLQSHDIFNEFAVFDEGSGDLRFRSKAHQPHVDTSKIDGVYSRLGEDLCLFFRSGNNLILKVGEQKLELSDDFRSNFYRENDLNVFELFKNDYRVFRYAYQPPELLVSLKDDPTAFAEYEDFDFFYLVHCVARDQDRKARIFR